MQYKQYRSKTISQHLNVHVRTTSDPQARNFPTVILPVINVTVLESRQSLVIVLGTAGHLLVCKCLNPPARLHCHRLFGDLLCALQGAFLVPCQTETQMKHQIQTYSISVTTHALFKSRQWTLKHSVMISHS